MDITNSSQLRADVPSAQVESTPRSPLRLDAGSWLAVAAFVAYIGIGLLA